MGNLEDFDANIADHKGHIHVWPFYDAPKALRDLSPHGGDEDWLALVPRKMSEEMWIGWLDTGTPFGVCDVSTHEVAEGVVYIGAHA